VTDKTSAIIEFRLAIFARITNAAFYEWVLGGTAPHLRRSAQQADLPAPSSQRSTFTERLTPRAGQPA
jgi:hypothetical protein